jgi:hypothetical protein
MGLSVMFPTGFLNQAWPESLMEWALLGHGGLAYVSRTGTNPHSMGKTSPLAFLLSQRGQLAKLKAQGSSSGVEMACQSPLATKSRAARRANAISRGSLLRGPVYPPSQTLLCAPAHRLRP